MIPIVAPQATEQSADAILAELARRNVVLSVEAGKLRFRAPVGALTAELREAIARRRVEIIRRLTATDAAAIPAGPPKLPPRCVVHIDPRDWIDAPPANGRIRATCRRCGAFIGYRAQPEATPIV